MMELHLFGGGFNSISYHELECDLEKFCEASAMFSTLYKTLIGI